MKSATLEDSNMMKAQPLWPPCFTCRLVAGLVVGGFLLCSQPASARADEGTSPLDSAVAAAKSVVESVTKAINEPKVKKSTKVDGVIYSHLGAPLDESDHRAFDVDRVYLSVKSTLDDRFKTRLTLDVGRLSGQGEILGPPGVNEDYVKMDSKLRSYLKYAYLEWYGSMPGIKIRFGAAATGWIGFYDKLWGHRYVSKAFTDDTKLLSSSDIGVHVLGKHRKGMVQYHLSLVNGEGYSKPEVDDGKAAQLRFTVDPLAGTKQSLPLSAFVSYELGVPTTQGPAGEDTTRDPTLVYALGGGYKGKLGLVWGEFVSKTKGGMTSVGASGSVVVNVGEKAHVLVRADSLNPDTLKKYDATTKVRLGVTYDFAKKVSAALLYEHLHPQDDENAETEETPEHGVYVRMQAGF